MAALPDPLPSDPLPLVAAWLADAATRVRNATAMTLATVDAAGDPTARMVISRGFDATAGWSSSTPTARARRASTSPRVRAPRASSTGSRSIARSASKVP